MNVDELEQYEKAINALLDFVFEKTIVSVQNLAIKARNQFFLKSKKLLKNI